MSARSKQHRLRTIAVKLLQVRVKQHPQTSPPYCVENFVYKNKLLQVLLFYIVLRLACVPCMQAHLYRKSKYCNGRSEEVLAESSASRGLP
eukprot:scaffold100822_cov15-Tisochrysis_lutea.AAC.1